MSTDRPANPIDHRTESDLRWRESFETAIQYFADNLDSIIPEHDSDGIRPNQPSTAREYFKGRGWNDQTISYHSLGWSPAGDNNKLRSHLEQSGYTDQEMLATGLFTEELEPRWHGRYVFPYLNEHDRPVYAISRATEHKSHPEDHLSKYAQIPHSHESVRVSEPIFGLRTIREGEPVIITEGIADALTVQQAGYPCVSPVTTQFKKKAKPKLLEKLESNSVSRVYVIQDAEPPSSDDTDNTLSVKQFEPGITGAVKTATFLQEHGINAQINTPPRIGGQKVDVHDFLSENWGLLEPLLRSAKPPSHHSAYVTPKSRKESTTPPNTESSVRTDSWDKSRIYSLELTDLLGHSVGFRGKNPLGHTGDSEDYYEVNNRDWAHDYKRNADYNALTHLLCESGERPICAPNGQLSGRDRFIAWKHAKNSGVIPEDDPIPHEGLIYLAVVENNFCDREDLEGRLLPPNSYNSALEVVRDEYGLDPGREPIGSAKPTTSLKSNDTKSAKSDTQLELTLETARKECEQTIDQALANDSQYDLINALPAQGKSYGVVKWAAKNETPLTVLTPRRDLHEQNKGWCEEFGLTFYSLPAFHRNCGSARGDHGSTWKDDLHSLYNAGVHGKQIHSMAQFRFGEELPCMQNGQCSYLSQLDFDPEDYDVLLGTYLHGHMDKVVEDRVVAIDESPSSAFTEGFTHDEVVRAVSHFLSNEDGLRFKNYTDLIENRSDKYRRADAKEWFETHQPNLIPDSTAVMKNKSHKVNAKAPLMTYALLVGNKLDNEWEHASFDSSRVSARNRNPKSEHGEHELTFLLPPSFDDARNVIGLDGTPCNRQWGLCLGHPVEHWQVLDDAERASYIRDGLSQEIYQMSVAAKSYSSGTWVKLAEDTALIEQVAEREQRVPDLITSQMAIKQYQKEGLLDSVGKWKYYGNLIGSNDFENSRLGVVTGSPHYGDNYLKMWGAFANETVERIGEGDGMNVDYGPFGNELLHEMRESDVLQSIMRFGRDGDGATIFVSTGAIPDWVPLAGKGEVKQWSDGMKLVISEITERNKWITDDLLTESDDRKTPVLDTDEPDLLSEKQVRRNLKTLRELGFISGEKEGNGTLWANIALNEIPDDRYVSYEG